LEETIDPVLPFRAMAYNNAWANHRLLSACAQLSQTAFSEPRSGFFGSIKATLNHTLCIDRFFIDAMEGGDLGPAAWADPEPCATAERLRIEQQKIDHRLLILCDHLTASDLDRIVEVHRTQGVQRERLSRLLLHLFQHQIHHRGQVHAMMSSTSVAPPQLDEFFSEDEADLRAREFAELGWTEETIWRRDRGGE